MRYEPLARLYVSVPLAAASPVILEGKAAHYVAQVLRGSVGEKLWLFNGQDGEWEADIADAGKKSVTLLPRLQTRPQQAEAGPWLLFAPIKFGRIDYLVEKAVELGASALYPVRTERTIAGRINGERLQAHAVEAAEQSERLTVPEVQPLQPLATALGKWPEGRTLYYGDETGQGEPAGAEFAHAKGEAALLVGPEGGFTLQELAQLRAHPAAVAVSLGPRVLRADTAALAMLATYQAIAGDWDSARPAFRGMTGEMA